MRFINRKRGSGKTISLVYASYVTGYPIIVRDYSHEKVVIELAKSLGLDIRVYTLEEYLRNSYICKKRIPREDGLLIDEAEYIIEIALKELLGAPIAACTFTIPCKDIKKMEEAIKNE